jgi:glycosyltransferase involved in cell wall biosynthesis
MIVTPDPRPPTPNSRSLKIAYLTAGAAGMICGSCLHDNTLARALIALGHDVQLVPLYTPIRTDEEDATSAPIFYGGINMYLQQQAAIFRWLPKWLDRWLDQPWLINWAAGKSVKIDPRQVADLTVSILRGAEGFQRKEVERLAEWLTGDLKPDVIVFSNILTAGCVPEIKRRLNVPIVVTLQGDDIFLRGLPPPYEAKALAEIRRLSGQIDAFIAHSRYYADAMAAYLGLPRERIHIVPLGVETRDFVRGGETRRQGNEEATQTVGYLARLAPEKGLHVLAEAFILLRRMAGMERVRLRVAGWLGDQHRAYVKEIYDKLQAAGLSEAIEFLGEVDRRGKIDFLNSLDVLAVPTTYKEPKGLFVLEALAAGVPVVQPDHGAFPEVLAETQGGLLHRPEDPEHLAQRLHELLANPEQRQRLATQGQQHVVANRGARQMAERTAEVLATVIRAALGRVGSEQPAFAGPHMSA